MKTCPRCGSTKWWYLSTGQIRCSQCGLTRKVTKNLWKKSRLSPYWKGRLIQVFLFRSPCLSSKISSSLQPADHFSDVSGCSEKPFTEIALKTCNRSLERSKWMKPYSVAGDQASEAGEHQERILSLASIRETGKYLLFLSPPEPERP